MTSSTVLISEVGPRDGLQSVKATMPTADKLTWIDGLYAAGIDGLHPFRPQTKECNYKKYLVAW